MSQVRTAHWARRVARPAALVIVALAAFTACSKAGEVEHVNVSSKQPQLVIDPQGLSGDPVVSVDVSHDNRLVAAASGKEVRVWSLPDRKLYATLRGYREPGGYHGGTINVVKFISRNNHLAVAVSDNTPAGSTRVFDLAHPDRIAQLLPGHRGCTRALAVSPSGEHLATSGCDGRFISYTRRPDGAQWRVETAEHQGSDAYRAKLTYVDDAHQSPLNTLQWFGFVGSGDWFMRSYYAAIAPADPQRKTGPGLQLINPATGQNPTRFRDWPEDIHQVVHYLHDGKAPRDGRNKLFDFTAQDLRVGGHPWYAVSGKDKQTEQSGKVNYWAASYSGDDASRFTAYRGHRFTPSAVAIGHADAERDQIVASGDHLGEVHVWSSQDGERVARFRPRVTQFYGVRFSADGGALQFSTRPYAGDQYQYNHFGPITHSFQLASRRLAIEPADPDARDAGSPEVVLRGEGRRYTVAGYKGDLAYRDRSTWKRLTPAFADTDRMPAPRWIDQLHFGDVYCYAAPPGGEGAGRPRVIVGSEKGALEEFELVKTSGGELRLSSVRKFIGHSARVTGISFSADGRRMATCSWDGAIRLWSLEQRAANGDVDFFADGTSVTKVPARSNAQAAGIQRSDIITHFDGAPFFERFQAMAKQRYRPGDRVRVDYLRLQDGQDGWDDHGVPIASSYAQKTATVELVQAPTYVEPYLTLFLSNDDQWVLFTPSGYYDASPGGEAFIGWHINRERHETALYYKVDQFRESLYRPDIVDAVLDTHDEESAVQAAQTSLTGIAEAPYPDVAEAPRVEFLTPESPLETAAEAVRIAFSVTYAAADPVRRIDLRVGDRLAAGLPRVVEEETQGGRVTQTYEATVSPPAADAFITATAIGRTMASAPARIEVRRPKSVAAESSPNLYILSVGISEYARSDLNLNWAAQDAEDFVAAWKAQQGRFYSTVEARVLTNEAAGVNEIREGIGWLADRSGVRPYDVAMVYLAGHGLFSKRGRWYFGGHELDPARLRSTALPQSELVDLIDRDLTCRTLLFADTCHATGIRESGAARLTHPQKRDPWLGMHCMALVSCTSRQESVESDAWRNGAFTEAILATLNSQATDTDSDGRLSFDELQGSVRRETKRLAKSLGFDQTPAIQIPTFVSDVYLATAPGD